MPHAPAEDPPDPRQNDAVILELVRTIRDDVADMRGTLQSHITTEPKEWAKVLSDLMVKAFPEGDADGHRRFHEANIKSAEKRAEFWTKMTYEITKWGLIGFLLWTLKTLVEAAAVWVHHGGQIK
jgi:hypothetical protein